MTSFSRKLGFNPFKSSGSAAEPSTPSSSSAGEPRPTLGARASFMGSQLNASAKAAANKASDKARRLSATASLKAREARHSLAGAKLDPTAPARVGFVGVSRDRTLISWAEDDQEVTERYASLARRIAQRADPPGWDDVADTNAKGAGLRAIKLPVCDRDGTTSYVVAFGMGYPVQKAQALCERLALMLGPMVDANLEQAAAQGRTRCTKDGAAQLREVLVREIRDANSSAQLQRVSNQVEAVRGIMERNVEMLLDRGEKLDQLEGKADDLNAATKAFRAQARKLKRWHLMNQVKWGVAVGTLVTASIAIPIAVLAAA